MPHKQYRLPFVIVAYEMCSFFVCVAALAKYIFARQENLDTLFFSVDRGTGSMPVGGQRLPVLLT
jgi:hypothetical protein